ncbi:cupin domain-containing protein [Fontivita pretiosa]|uniref:cupin domain-containing protein n=1 Tax=Fontivita pretiosa TaxID=2989684 RepID=UPI003D185CD2
MSDSNLNHAATSQLAAGPATIGGVSLTLVRVYADRAAPDGLHSGCPHVHGLTDEAYYCVGGRGAVELHSLSQGFHTVELQPGAYVQFSANVVHRLINHDGSLEVLAIIANAGLAERGDARVWFGPEVDADPRRYQQLMMLASEQGIEGALRRRDEAVRAYVSFRQLWTTDRAKWEAELRRFIDVHLSDLARQRQRLAAAIESGPVAAATLSRRRLDALPHMLGSDLAGVCEPGQPETLGMCGRLRQLDRLVSVRVDTSIHALTAGLRRQ